MNYILGFLICYLIVLLVSYLFGGGNDGGKAA